VRLQTELIRMHINHAKRTLIILTLALAGCRAPISPPSPTPEIRSLRLAADSATLPLLRDLTGSYQPSGVTITWDIQVSEGQQVADWLKSGIPYGLTDYLPEAMSGLWSTSVGQDAIAIIVPVSNPIGNLTAAQLRGILQGRIDNWKLLGGADLPITVVARDDTSSAATVLQSIVLGDRRTTLNARLAPSDQAAIDIVGGLPGGLGYVSINYLDSTVRAVPIEGVALAPQTVNVYPIRAPIVFVGATEPNAGDYRAFFAWVQSPAGQAIVQRHCGGIPTQ
jgi:phosphate transport system substrate-binding protein